MIHVHRKYSFNLFFSIPFKLIRLLNCSTTIRHQPICLAENKSRISLFFLKSESFFNEPQSCSFLLMWGRFYFRLSMWDYIQSNVMYNWYIYSMKARPTNQIWNKMWCHWNGFFRIQNCYQWILLKWTKFVKKIYRPVFIQNLFFNDHIWMLICL